MMNTKIEFGERKQLEAGFWCWLKKFKYQENIMGWEQIEMGMRKKTFA